MAYRFLLSSLVFNALAHFSMPSLCVLALYPDYEAETRKLRAENVGLTAQVAGVL